MRKTGFWHGFTVTAGQRIKNHQDATKRWRENNQERYKAASNAYSKKWTEENREKRREIGRKYYQRHKAKEAERKKAYQQANKDKVNEIARRYRQRQKELEILPRCHSCSSILQNTIDTHCYWCITTYGITRKTRDSTGTQGRRIKINHYCREERG